MIGYLVVALLVAIFIWRVVLPSQRLQGSKKASGAYGPSGKDWGEWFKKYQKPMIVAAIAVVVLIIIIGVWWFWKKFAVAASGVAFPDLTGYAVPFAIIIAAVIVSTYVFGGDTATKIRKGAWAAVVAFVAISSLLLYGNWKEGGFSDSMPEQTRGIPLATEPQSTWLPANIQAGGKSKLLPYPPGMRVVAKGNNFLSHYVYADGRECAFGSNCPDGPTGLYFSNTSSTSPTLVMYAYQ